MSTKHGSRNCIACGARKLSTTGLRCRSCADKLYRKPRPTCAWCGAMCERVRRYEHKFCSRECQYAWASKHRRGDEGLPTTEEIDDFVGKE